MKKNKKTNDDKTFLINLIEMNMLMVIRIKMLELKIKELKEKINEL